jgi:microcystin-dependent protein
MYRIGANNLGIGVNGAKVLDIATTGLTVTGALAVSGALTVGGERVVPIGASTDYDGPRAPNGWLFKYAQAISRSTYALLFAALTETTTGDTNTSTSITNVSEDLRDLGLVGAYIEGTGIPSGTTITAVGAASITLSQAATGSAAGLTLTILPHGQGDGSTTFNVPDDRGRVNPGRDNMGGTSANRLTAQTGGIEGDNLGAVGGAETATLTRANLPNTSVTVTITDPGHTHTLASQGFSYNGSAVPGSQGYTGTPTSPTTSSNTTGISAAFNLNDNVTQTAVNNVQPSRVTNKIIFTGVYS